MRIIGLAGYAGTGKDTVAIIAQYILGGIKTKLKFSLEEAVNDYYKHEMSLSWYSEWEIKKYAGKLKEVAALLLGTDVKNFENQDFKKVTLGPQWNEMSVRQFLQRLGTDAIRMGLHENAWVNALWADYTEQCNWLITDVRFINEAQAIKSMGGVIVRINRPGVRHINQHISELELDHWQFDHIIENSSDLTMLLLEVGRLLQKLKLVNADEDNKADN